MATVTGSFALTGNCFYISPNTTDYVPTSIGMFAITLNPCSKLNVGATPELYGRDVNNRIYQRDITRPYPKEITLAFDISSLSEENLQTLYGYFYGATRLWAIDGVGIGGTKGNTFRYSYDSTHSDNTKDLFNLLAEADKAEYTHLPYICVWGGYITAMDGGFYSSRKMGWEGQITFGVNGVITALQHNAAVNLLWNSTGS